MQWLLTVLGFLGPHLCFAKDRSLCDTEEMSSQVDFGSRSVLPEPIQTVSTSTNNLVLNSRFPGFLSRIKKQTNKIIICQ